MTLHSRNAVVPRLADAACQLYRELEGQGAIFFAKSGIVATSAKLGRRLAAAIVARGGLR